MHKKQNPEAKAFMNNFKYAFASNLIGLIISPLTVLILPKLLGVDEFGYYQFFAFLVEYFCLLHLGIIDGLYLKYGGMQYDNLDKPYFKKLITSFFIMQFFAGLFVSLCGYLMAQVPEKKFIFICLGISTLFTNSKTILQFIFQATGKIKEYAFVNISDRLFFLMSILIALAVKIDNFVPLIIIYLATKFASLLVACSYARDIFKAKEKCSFRRVMLDIPTYSKTGLNLTFSYLASIAVIGIVRVAIENQWNIATFSKISFTLSISSLLMIFIRAVSMIMFPTLRRVAKDKLSWIYQTMRISIMVSLLCMLIFYYPCKTILAAWLPQYADSLKYMAVLFPMCIFESKMNMIIETYMKTLRLEKKLLLVNIVTLTLSFIVTGVTVFWFHNLDLAVMSIVALLAFRCVLAELLLSKHLHINVKKDIILELTLTAIFIFSSWTIGGILGVVIYSIAYTIYLFIQRKQIISLIQTIKKFSEV